MAFPYDLSTPEGLLAFREAAKVPDGVGIQPVREGVENPRDAVVLSSYIILEVGLRFPLPVDLCYLLNELRLWLECCKPNVLRLLLGISFVNERLNIFLGNREVLVNYSFTISHGEPYFQIAPSGKNLIVAIDEFNNRN